MPDCRGSASTMNFIPDRTETEQIVRKVSVTYHYKVRKTMVFISHAMTLCLHHPPVRVWKQWSLKTSVSSISIPELPTSGDSCEPIANNLRKTSKLDVDYWNIRPAAITFVHFGVLYSVCVPVTWIYLHYTTPPPSPTLSANTKLTSETWTPASASRWSSAVRDQIE